MCHSVYTLKVSGLCLNHMLLGYSVYNNTFRHLGICMQSCHLTQLMHQATDYPCSHVSGIRERPVLAAKVDDALESETFPPAVIQKQTGKGSRSAPEHDHQ